MKTALVFTAAILLRLGLIYFGYTDIDYLVFTDAARLTAHGRSPYDRATYRYTPLLAWLLYPTAWSGLWFEFGKVMFASADVLTGWLILLILRPHTKRATEYACIWLLNPMVASISARGSSEGLLALLTIALLWATLERRAGVAGLLLGIAVHFKIYPFIYAASIFWWLEPSKVGSVRHFRKDQDRPVWLGRALTFFNRARMKLVFTSAITFVTLNSWMLNVYGWPFFEHTFLYHLTRIDHRHNFSLYNTILHLNSASVKTSSNLNVESLAFIPQLLLSLALIPLALARKDLAGCMMAQTFAFVTFNKVCTSQYFLWYLAFLPVYLPRTKLLWGKRGIAMIVLWVLGQAAWLQQGYELEFLGKSTFVPGLWAASIAFFVVNCWILRIMVEDVAISAKINSIKKRE